MRVRPHRKRPFRPSLSKSLSKTLSGIGNLSAGFDKVDDKAFDKVAKSLSLEEFRHDVVDGLSRPAKSIPCKYLYDEAGARLFDAICDLEEYYPTRTETAILRRNIREIAALLGPRCTLVEPGSGAGSKTRLLLDHLDSPEAYVPIDVADRQLLECSARLAADYPLLKVSPVCADYTHDFELPPLSFGSQRTIAVFLGSTIGNFEPQEAGEFLQRLARLCGNEGGLLIGVDLKKDPPILHRAYNDAQGVTAAFNLNLLGRINRDLAGRLEGSLFRHEAFYNERAGRIEMHLVSRLAQGIRIGSDEFLLAEGESIRTEHSYKYTRGEFLQLAADAGLEVKRCWTDQREWFSVHYLAPFQRDLPAQQGWKKSCVRPVPKESFLWGARFHRPTKSEVTKENL